MGPSISTDLAVLVIDILSVSSGTTRPVSFALFVALSSTYPVYQPAIHSASDHALAINTLIPTCFSEQ